MGEPRTSMDLMRETLLALTLDGTPYRIDGNGFVWLPRDDGVEGERTGHEFKVLAHLAGRVRALEAALSAMVKCSQALDDAADELALGQRPNGTAPDELHRGLEDAREAYEKARKVAAALAGEAVRG